MITALDTNVLFDILLGNDVALANKSAEAIANAAEIGGLAICDIVYTELCTQFTRREECDLFLDENEIRVESLDRNSSFLAAQIWRKYRDEGGKRERILSDFLIGAHAKQQTNRLISRDRGFYGKYFRNLQLIDPSKT